MDIFTRVEDIDYTMTETDKLMSDVAKIIINAYNTANKPWIIKDLKNYTILHNDKKGYQLIKDNGSEKIILLTNSNVVDFAHYVFIVLGQCPVRRTTIVNSNAVNRELKRYFIDYINKNGKKINYEYRQLDTVEDYLKAPTYCGVLRDNEFWTFVYQDNYFWGDNPKQEMLENKYETLIDLVLKETVAIYEKCTNE